MNHMKTPPKRLAPKEDKVVDFPVPENTGDEYFDKYCKTLRENRRLRREVNQLTTYNLILGFVIIALVVAIIVTITISARHLKSIVDSVSQMTNLIH